MMDSLEIPFDLIWEGKMEQFSPIQAVSAFANAEDILIFDDDNNDFAEGNKFSCFKIKTVYFYVFVSF